MTQESESHYQKWLTWTEWMCLTGKGWKLNAFQDFVFLTPDVASPLFLSTAWEQIVIPPRAKENPSQESRGCFTTEQMTFSATAQSHLSAGLAGFWALSSLFYIRGLGVQRNTNVFPLTHFTTRTCQALSFCCSVHADFVAAASPSHN